MQHDIYFIVLSCNILFVLVRSANNCPYFGTSVMMNSWTSAWSAQGEGIAVDWCSSFGHACFQSFWWCTGTSIPPGWTSANNSIWGPYTEIMESTEDSTSQKVSQIVAIPWHLSQVQCSKLWRILVSLKFAPVVIESRDPINLLLLTLGVWQGHPDFHT